MSLATQKAVRRRDALTAYAFLAPFLVIYLTFLVLLQGPVDQPA